MLEPKTDLPPQSTIKRQKLKSPQRHQTPSSFWDNLSRQWLTRRALREFDRRTVWPTTPPRRTGKGNIDLLKLKRLARHGGPSLSDIRGYPDPEVFSNPIMNSSRSKKRAKTGRESGTSFSTRRTSAYDPAFEQHLIDHGIYKNNRAQKPSNWAEINERLAQPRPSLSPLQFTEAAYETFLQTNEEALTENKVMSNAFPIITGTTNIPSEQNLQFTNLKDLTDGSITQAQPDFYDGARPEELNKYTREERGPYIIPSTHTAAPCLPNFFTEGKGPGGPPNVNKLQACYDGAIGERGMLNLSSYNNTEIAPYDTSHTLTSTYHGGTGDLTIYSTHASRSSNPQQPTEYRMTQLRGWKMTDTADTFREGATALRNARDWAKEKRGEFIAAANSRVPVTEYSGLESSTQSRVSASSNMLAPPESETSADELALDTFASSRHRNPVRARSKPKVSSNRRSKKTSQVNKRRSTRPEASHDI